MPANRRTPWLICYDIADPHRLREVHRHVRQYAAPLQYSVFQAHQTRREIVQRLGELKHVIDPIRDDVRAYPLLTVAPLRVYGRDLLAADVRLAW